MAKWGEDSAWKAGLTAALLGMVVRAPKQRVEAAEQMLAGKGKTWETARRPLRRLVKSETGVEKYLGDWVMETRDPELRHVTIVPEEGIIELSGGSGGTKIGKFEPSRVRYGGKFAADFRFPSDVFDVPYTRDSVFDPVWGKVHPRITLQIGGPKGVGGAFIPEHGDVYLGGVTPARIILNHIESRSPLEVEANGVHEYQHALDAMSELGLGIDRSKASPELLAIYDGLLKKYGDYLGQPTEQRAYNVEFRHQNLTPEQRAKTLLEDTARDSLRDVQEILKRNGERQDAKGGKSPDRFALSRNFLATDETPDTLFGIPVVADRSQYTPEDLAFFRKHPEAGGYYDMGDEEGAPGEPPMQAASKAGDASEKAVPSKTRSESEAVQALYEGVTPAAVEAMRARTIRARGGDPDKVTLGEIATTGAPVVRDGFDPEPYGSYTVEYRPDGRRAVAMSARGVAEIADRTAQREELTHLLDPGGAEPAPQGWTRKPGEPLGDLYQRRAQSVNGDTVDREANYYVYGRRSEREMAMSILKQAIGRNFAAAGGDPVERTSGAAILGMLSDYADHRLAPGDDLPFIEEAKGDGYSFHRLKADDKASLPGKKVLQEYIKLYEKTKDGEPLNEVEREAWEQLSNPDAWDRVVSVDRFGKAVHAATGAGKPKKKIPPIVRGPLRYGPPPPPSRGKYPGIANNPGNVEKHERRSDKTLFKGEIAGGVRPKRFANFSDPVDGLIAAATVLSRRAAGLAAKGLPFTIENYVPGYAPNSENDTERYINNLSKYSGFARDAVLDTGNVDDMAKLLRNVVRFESGVPNSEWFTDEEYRRAARAMNRSLESAPSLPASTNRQASGGSTQTSEETRRGE